MNKFTALYGESPYMTATFEKDTSTNSEDAAVEVYAKLRQGEKVPVDGARSFIASRLF